VSETTERLAGLRKRCLQRDRHRCVVNRVFDLSEARTRIKRDGANAKDDDDHLLNKDTERLDVVQVAHILPYSLMTNSGEMESKRNARKILDMFDNGVICLIEGIDIDQPTNELTLTIGLHQMFGDFEIYFESISGTQTSHTYTIRQTIPVPYRDYTFPIIRKLCESPDRDIDRILKDMEDPIVKSDGTTKLGYLVSLRLGGWWDGT
jgi:hypothetical protein